MDRTQADNAARCCDLLFLPWASPCDASNRTAVFHRRKQFMTLKRAGIKLLMLESSSRVVMTNYSFLDDEASLLFCSKWVFSNGCSWRMIRVERIEAIVAGWSLSRADSLHVLYLYILQLDKELASNSLMITRQWKSHTEWVEVLSFPHCIFLRLSQLDLRRRFREVADHMRALHKSIVARHGEISKTLSYTTSHFYCLLLARQPGFWLSDNLLSSQFPPGEKNKTTFLSCEQHDLHQFLHVARLWLFGLARRLSFNRSFTHIGIFQNCGHHWF